MQCINCGKKINNKSKHCPNCGKYQPLADTNEKKARRPILSGLSVVLLVLGLLPLPILLIGIISLIFAGTLSNVSIVEIIVEVVKFILITSGIPLVLSFICKVLGK